MLSRLLQRGEGFRQGGEGVGLGDAQGEAAGHGGFERGVGSRPRGGDNDSRYGRVR